MKPTQPLKVYRASAGSGKTFTLAVEYIKLLIADQREYRHILAVTFTNKATAEMKQRILSTLYGLAHNLSGARGYMKVLLESPEIRELNISEPEIRRRAGIALENLAHDYSRFHIETIDSFFVSVIKDLARELDLTANLSIDLNSAEVLSEAVDNIIDGLQEGTTVFQNIKNFIQEKIDAETNWKIDAEVKDFGQNIFNEHYLAQSQAISDKIQDSNFMQSYRKQLWKAKTEALHQMQQAGQFFLQTCHQHGYSADDFKQKERGVWGFFDKLSAGRELPEPNSYVMKCLEGPEQWNSRNAALQQLVSTQLLPLLRQALSLLPETQKTVATVSTISRHLSHLQLLNTISNQVDQLNTQANRFLLANSAHFLQRMIDKSSVPFIYEKSGNRFRHIMIDEFQDTSSLQWSNFLPLLSNSLDAGQTCLIVGDVKQSIYRFRGSDWQILNSLDSVPELQGKIDGQKLDFNRRSLGHIIDFNNAFFLKAVAALNQDYRATHDGQDSLQLLRAYSDVSQKQLPEKEKRGFVHIDILRPQSSTSDTQPASPDSQPASPDSQPATSASSAPDYTEQTLSLLLNHVRTLLSQGIRQRDITILLRYNRHIPVISNYFAQNAKDIKLVSDEAFQLRASASINVIIAALRYLSDQENNKYALVQLVSYYSHYVLQAANPDATDIGQLLLADTQHLLSLLPPAFAQHTDQLVYLPLKQLIQHLYVVFSLSDIPGQDAYLFYFHDQVTAFAEDKRADTASFLSHWDDTLSLKTIPNSIDDGVRIMSIHKSKGLEFHTVIIPFCDWKTTGKPTELLWCQPRQEPYSQLPLTPVNFTEEMHRSIFSADYEHEVLLNNVDNLNLLYVAFTRAVCNLIILTQQYQPPKGKTPKSAGSRSNTATDADSTPPIKDISHLMARSLPDFMEGDEALEYGTLVVEPENKDTDDENVLTRPYEKTPVAFTTHNSLPQFRQSNKSKDFIAASSESATDDSQPPSRTYIDRGLLYHSIFQEINTLDDIDPVIEKMNMQGHFRSLAERDQVSRHIHKAFSDPFASRWFNDQWKVVNERTILYPQPPTSPGGKIQWQQMRADRVIMSDRETIVIDYKTGHYSADHAEQVRRYMEKLTQMGYPNVKGYVWYIMTGKTHKVDAE